MKYVITTILIACGAITATTLYLLLPPQPQPVPLTAEVTPKARFAIHARCARLAELSGNKSQLKAHLKAARLYNDNGLVMMYYVGFIDGGIASAVGKRTVKEVAAEVYEDACPPETFGASI